MENTTVIKLELEVMASRIINQFMINNAAVEKEIEEGLKKAFESFNFKDEVEKIALNAIKDAIASSANYGKIRDIVKKKSEEIITELSDKYFEEISMKLKKE
jgi:20S proteasome alpha/beta subunit